MRIEASLLLQGHPLPQISPYTIPLLDTESVKPYWAVMLRKCLNLETKLQSKKREFYCPCSQTGFALPLLSFLLLFLLFHLEKFTLVNMCWFFSIHSQLNPTQN